MPVRFKGQSEYQKSYGVLRSRSVSPQHCVPLAGLRSDHMGISREPCLQRRRKLSPSGPGGLSKSCSSLLRPSEPQHHLAEPAANTPAPPAASRSRSAHRKEPPVETDPLTPPGERAGPPAEPETPAGPRPAADPGPSEEPEAAGKSAKPRPSKQDSQPELSRPLTAAADGQQPSANEVQHALRRRAGLTAGGQRSGNQRSEYHRQFGWKKPVTSASPLLTAEQVLFSSSRSVPPFKKHPVPMETEYRRCFQGQMPPAEPRLRKHLDAQHRVPLFHTQTANKKRRQESEKRPRPKQEDPAPLNDEATPPPPQVQRGHRTLTEYQSRFRSPLCRIPEGGGATDADALQVAAAAAALRQQALLYRRRAWGANFSRDHLSQLQSEHNALWEPADTTDSSPPSPRLTSDLRAPSVEALDLSSQRSSVSGSAHTHTHTPPSTPAGRCTAWDGEGGEEEGENTDDEEGRLPTPRLKIRPVQRTHHDLTTPATGGAILVGKLKNGDESSPHKQAEAAVAASVKPKEAWSDNNPTHLPPPSSPSTGPSPNHKPAASPASKPIRKQQAPSPVAPPPLVPPPQHGIQGTLRHADFQHNGELGLRFREPPCSGGSDQDDRLSVMSWRSAASCSMASAVLERARKRRENFWGKR